MGPTVLGKKTIREKRYNWARHETHSLGTRRTWIKKWRMSLEKKTH